MSDIPDQIGPAAHANLYEITSRAGQMIEILNVLDQDAQNHELKQTKEPLIDECYISRKLLLYRIRRVIKGAIIQAQFHASEDPKGHKDTVNYIGAGMNADMAFNIYVHTIKDAADAHHIIVPNDLWIIDANFTGPMIEDGN